MKSITFFRSLYSAACGEKAFRCRPAIMLLSVSLLFGGVATAQTRASGTSNGCTWTVSGTGVSYILTIAPTAGHAQSGTMADYAGYTSMPWSSYKDTIKTLVIQQGVSYLGKYAFSDHDQLTSVTIPNSVTGAGERVFESCNGLTTAIFAPSAQLATLPVGFFTSAASWTTLASQIR